MPDRIRVREIVRPSDPAVREAYALLRRSFPPAELIPRAELLYSLREREAGVWADLRWHLFVALRGARVVGVATGSFVGSLNVGLIGYLAVDQASGRRGLGPRLRRRLVQGFERDARTIGGSRLGAVVGEVEADNPWLGHLVRRYRAIPLDFPYVQPEVRREQGTVPLVLYWQPLGRAAVTRLPAAEVRRLAYMIWRRSYRVARPLLDPRFRRMLQGLDRRRAVGSRSLPPARPMETTRE